MERKTEEELLSCYSPFYFVTFMAIVNFYICEADQPESIFIRRINILRRIGNGILPFLSLISGFPVGTSAKGTQTMPELVSFPTVAIFSFNNTTPDNSWKFSSIFSCN